MMETKHQEELESATNEQKRSNDDLIRVSEALDDKSIEVEVTKTKLVDSKTRISQFEEDQKLLLDNIKHLKRENEKGECLVKELLRTSADESEKSGEIISD